MEPTDDWQQRLKDEYAELGARSYRLNQFMHSHFAHAACSDDDDEQLGLMKVQLRIMDSYMGILEERARLAGIQL